MTFQAMRTFEQMLHFDRRRRLSMRLRLLFCQSRPKYAKIQLLNDSYIECVNRGKYNASTYFQLLPQLRFLQSLRLLK